MLLPVMPLWLLRTEGFSPVETGVAMGIFGVGLYLLGWLCSWLVQHYRRNVVCMWAVVAQALCVLVLWYIETVQVQQADVWLIMAQRLALGAFFGLSQMVLASTLIIDTCESAQRTEANHSVGWFRRFSLSLGPLAGLVVYDMFGFHVVVWASAGCAVLALLMIKLVDFPFRAPDDEVHVVSLDRFLLPRGFLLFLNLLLVTTVFGLIITLPLSVLFYAVMMGGFLVALLAQRFVFRNAELESEVLSGLILLLAALLVLWVSFSSPVAPLLVGFSVGIISSRFLLFFIKLSRHCQRGTSQSTCFLGWESGLALGLALGYALFYHQTDRLIYTALALTVVALLMYHFLTHRWFLRHKNR